MKLQILPPTRLKTKYYHVVQFPELFRGAHSIIAEVGAAYRYRRRLAGDVQRDLIRFSALHSLPVYYFLRGEMPPYALFARTMVEQWLDEGGRAWIVAELEARSSRRVVPFPSKNGGVR